jgi:hypothetical protein
MCVVHILKNAIGLRHFLLWHRLAEPTQHMPVSIEHSSKRPGDGKLLTGIPSESARITRSDLPAAANSWTVASRLRRSNALHSRA